MRGVQPAPKASTLQGDTLQRVTQKMGKQNVAGLPRNYELFHEAMFGHDAGLTRDLDALGNRPSQLHLDQLGLKYRLVSHCGLAEEKIQRDAVSILKELANMLTAGVEHKQTFVRSLETISRSIREEDKHSFGSIVSELEFLDAAAAELTRSEYALAETLKSGLAQVDAAERAAQQAHAAASRDRLTGLPNRLAVTRRLQEMYNGDTPHRTALVAVEADDLSAVRRQYGEDATIRLLKRMASIFRKTIKKNDYVARNDGGQFLFIFNDVAHDDVLAITERLRNAVETNLIYAADNELNGGGLQLTVGFSLSEYATRADELLGQAEHALKSAQQESRSAVVCFGRKSTGRGRSAS